LQSVHSTRIFQHFIKKNNNEIVTYRSAKSSTEYAPGSKSLPLGSNGCGSRRRPSLLKPYVIGRATISLINVFK